MYIKWPVVVEDDIYKIDEMEGENIEKNVEKPYVSTEVQKMDSNNTDNFVVVGSPAQKLCDLFQKKIAKPNKDTKNRIQEWLEKILYTFVFFVRC